MIAFLCCNDFTFHVPMSHFDNVITFPSCNDFTFHVPMSHFHNVISFPYCNHLLFQLEMFNEFLSSPFPCYNVTYNSFNSNSIWHTTHSIQTQFDMVIIGTCQFKINVTCKSFDSNSMSHANHLIQTQFHKLIIWFKLNVTS